MRPLVYIAGPYTTPDPCVNTHAAIKLADSLLDVCDPFVPHLSHFWHTVSPKPYDEWLRLDLAYLHRCDALYRFGGKSGGADGELAYAVEWGIPVFRSLTDLRAWCARW